MSLSSVHLYLLLSDPPTNRPPMKLYGCGPSRRLLNDRLRCYCPTTRGKRLKTYPVVQFPFNPLSAGYPQQKQHQPQRGISIIGMSRDARSRKTAISHPFGTQSNNRIPSMCNTQSSHSCRPPPHSCEPSSAAAEQRDSTTATQQPPPPVANKPCLRNDGRVSAPTR